MANDKDLARIRQGAAVWNAWRAQNPERRIDLGEADLSGADLRGADLGKANLEGAILSEADLSVADLEEANLRWADLEGADLEGANLEGAILRGADLSEARLWWANLSGAFLINADLREADLREADLRDAQLSGAILWKTHLEGAHLEGANLSGATLWGTDFSHSGANLREAHLEGAHLEGANLSGANLSGATLRKANLSGANLGHGTLVGTDLTGANLTSCRVYGISAWDLKLKGAKQRDLVITTLDQPEITVDNLEVAQFIYLLLHNEKVRDIIDTITSKVVLILGRFTPERKAVLDALREELRKHDYLPVLFDFAKPDSKDLTGTVSTLANMARFLVADLTDPSSIPHELATVIPTTVVPVQPILRSGTHAYTMFVDLRKRYHWVLEPYPYETSERLIADLVKGVIDPAEVKVCELRGVKPG